MNFLHRLHPARGLERGAVRPDIAPLLQSAAVPAAALAGVPGPGARPGPDIQAAPSPAAGNTAPAMPQRAAAAVQLEHAPTRTRRVDQPDEREPASVQPVAAAHVVEHIVERETRTRVVGAAPSAPSASAASSTPAGMPTPALRAPRSGVAPPQQVTTPRVPAARRPAAEAASESESESESADVRLARVARAYLERNGGR